MTGSLYCVGVGMTLGAHICPLSRSYIENADVVFSGVSDGLVELWLHEMHPDVRSLQPFYGKGKSRHISYREMVDAILAEVKQHKNVVAAFYGHPGVFAKVPHDAIAKARELGFEAKMIPGISAGDCLFADLGMDPGQHGCQHYEASQFMLYQRRIDPSALLILWQIGLAGDLTMGIEATGTAERRLLLELLSQDYPLDHQCWLYEAATTPLQNPRMERLSLQSLLFAEISLHTTLVIPPLTPMIPNPHLRSRLQQLQHREKVTTQQNNVIPFSKKKKRKQSCKN
ncbi:SAM-dependent methyltransferase [Shewanella sp. YIC-542]|uniref:SAM-dependent methyltransferase n=1 Tax=Shewanella mytili TaxID=3377111 RepID=UPI00398EE215